MQLTTTTITRSARLGLTLGGLLLMASPHLALAWHPNGVITKDVRNVTTNSAFAPADTTSAAVAAKPGDILEYRMTVKNMAAAAAKNDNDLSFVVVSDTLPAGVELVGNSAAHTFSKDFGSERVAPGASITTSFQVKVVAKSNVSVKNTACFTGDSIVKDNKQQGCNDAFVTVTAPAATPTPTVTPKPTATPVSTPVVTPTPVVGGKGEVLSVTTLPDTGAPITGLIGLGAMVTAGVAYAKSRRS